MLSRRMQLHSHYRILLSILLAGGMHLLLLKMHLHLEIQNVFLPSTPAKGIEVQVGQTRNVNQKNQLQIPSQTKQNQETVEPLQPPDNINKVAGPQKTVNKNNSKSKKLPTANKQKKNRNLVKFPKNLNRKTKVQTSKKTSVIADDTGQIQSRLEENQKTYQTKNESLAKSSEDSRIIGVILDRSAEPISIENSPPVYPGLARKRGYQGRVILDVLVSGEGKVNDIRINATSGYAILDRAALKAVSDWQFLPAVKNGKKEVVWIKIPIRFELK